jgi:hypothetical protein
MLDVKKETVMIIALCRQYKPRYSSALVAGAIVALAMVALTDRAASDEPLAHVRSSAVAARTISLTASAGLRITRSHGSNIEASGTVSGTLRGSMAAHIVISSASRMTSSFEGTGGSGSLTGKGVANYGVSGNTIYYTGTATVTGGTGTYAHAHATSVRFEGTMNRTQKKITMHINGALQL